jgi:hypothetical protein
LRPEAFSEICCVINARSELRTTFWAVVAVFPAPAAAAVHVVVAFAASVAGDAALSAVSLLGRHSAAGPAGLLDPASAEVSAVPFPALQILSLVAAGISGFPQEQDVQGAGGPWDAPRWQAYSQFAVVRRDDWQEDCKAHLPPLRVQRTDHETPQA